MARQCVEAGIPFLFKQWGEWAPVKGVLTRVGKHEAGRLLDGALWDGYPVPRGGA